MTVPFDPARFSVIPPALLKDIERMTRLPFLNGAPIFEAVRANTLFGEIVVRQASGMVQAWRAAASATVLKIDYASIMPKIDYSPLFAAVTRAVGPIEFEIHAPVVGRIALDHARMAGATAGTIELDEDVDADVAEAAAKAQLDALAEVDLEIEQDGQTVHLPPEALQALRALVVRFFNGTAGSAFVIETQLPLVAKGIVAEPHMVILVALFIGIVWTALAAEQALRGPEESPDE